jgi:hypothetical protein
VHYSCNVLTGKCGTDSQGRYLDEGQCNRGCTVSNVPHYKCNPTNHTCSQDPTGPYTLQAQCQNNCGAAIVTPPPIVAPPTSVPTNVPGGNNPTSQPGGGNPGGGEPTSSPRLGCKECPTDFRCYKKGNDYKWFADGYAMEGYSRNSGASVLGLSCFGSIQTRLQPDVETDWTTQLSMNAGQTINIGCMHDGSGQPADGVNVTITKDSSVVANVEGRGINAWLIPSAGTYTIKCTDCDGTSDTATLVATGSMITPVTTPTSIPTDSATITDESCTSRGIVKPIFKGKSVGDANCDGNVDIYDQSVWGQEFNLTRGVDVTKTTWESDFNCDSKVNIYDLPIWTQSYKGGNQ